MTHLHHKPFEIEAARAGAPVGTRHGHAVELLKFFDAKIIGMHTSPMGIPFAAEWSIGGIYLGGNEHAGRLDLIMLPLGMCEDKPVFAGDKLEFLDGVPISIGADTRMFDNCKWPQPKPQFPQTKMTEAELYAAFCKYSGPFMCRDMIVANAAVERAIRDGQVFMPGQNSKEHPFGAVPKWMLHKVAAVVQDTVLAIVEKSYNSEHAKAEIKVIDSNQIIDRVLKGEL